MTDPSDKKAEETKAGSESARGELFEAIDHLKKAAHILIERAQKEPVAQRAEEALGKASKVAEPVVSKVTEAAEPVVSKVSEAAAPVVGKVSEAAEPLVKQAVSELSKLTKALLDAAQKPAKKDDGGSAGE